MKISIITATFNSVSTIESTIKSVLSQSYHDIEYIIVDGKSTDGTIDVIKRYANEKHLSFISERDEGIYDAINKGIMMATGDVVGLLHSDDFFADNEVVQRIVHSIKGVDAVYADIQFVDRENPAKVLRYYSSKYFKPWMFRFGFQPAHPTFYLKRQLFQTLGIYRTDMKIAGDFDLLFRMLKKEKIQAKYMNDLWVKMRIGGESTSGLKSIARLNKEIIQSLRDHNVYSNMLFIYAKYAFKWWGFIFNKG